MNASFIPPLVPSDETLREVNELTSKLLPIPDGAHLRGERYVNGVLNPQFTANWKEDLEIMRSSIVEDTKVPGRYIVKVLAKPLRMDAAGKDVWLNFYLAPKELNRVGRKPVKGDADYGQWKMTQMSCARLNEILRACGAEVFGTQVDYTHYFHSENGATPPVVGQKVTAAMRHKVDDQGTERQDADAGPGRQVFTKCAGVI